MEARVLVEAYVCMDRLLLHYLRQSPEHRKVLQDTLAAVEQQTSTYAKGGESLNRLCNSGCEREELVWLLRGCDGRALAGLTSAQELFGRPAELLKTNLNALEEAASILESINGQPFGILLRGTVLLDLMQLPDSLRLYVAAVEAAKRDFFHGAEWFLNIAKARLVDHVNYKTASWSDEEVSTLIGAVARKQSYPAYIHRQWRYQHKYLIGDPRVDPSGSNVIDPYTVWSAARRAEWQASMQEIMQDPACRTVWERALNSMFELLKTRYPKQT